MGRIVKQLSDTTTKYYWYPGEKQEWIRAVVAVGTGGASAALLMLLTRNTLAAVVVGCSVTLAVSGFNFGRRDAKALSGFPNLSDKAARRAAVDAATDAKQQLRALVITAPEPVRARFRGQTTRQMLATASRLRPHLHAGDVEVVTALSVLRALARRDLVGSMGRVGAAGDNAAMESFFSLLQKNVLDRRSWATREQLRIAIVTWIERTYHRRRRQPRLGRFTPIEFEAIMNTPAALAA